MLPSRISTSIQGEFEMKSVTNSTSTDRAWQKYYWTCTNYTYYERKDVRNSQAYDNYRHIFSVWKLI